MTEFIYHYKKLTNKRKKLRLSIIDVAKALTLSTTQIKSLENNLDTGFASSKYKLILLKRYAKLLGIKPENLFEVKEETEQTEENETLTTKSFSNIKISYLILGIFFLVFIFYLYYSDKTVDEKIDSFLNQSSNLSDIITPEQDQIELTDNPSKEIESLDQLPDNTVKNSEGNLEVEGIIEDNSIVTSDITPTQTTQSGEERIAKEETVNLNNDFLCTVQTSQTTPFTTKYPEKSSYYFYFISHGSQKICVADSLGALKEYDLNKGAKFSHHGLPPFKIQFNPNISEVYFEGWKVNFQEDDYFVQLNPTINP